MRKLLTLLLLAGSAAPALAAGDPGDRGGRHRDSGTQAASEADRGNRPERSERAHVERSGSDHQSQPAVHVERGNRGGNDGPPPQPVTHVEATHVEATGGGNSAEHRSNIEFRGRFNGGQGSMTRVETGGGRHPAARIETGGGGEVQRVRREDRGPDDVVRTSRGPRIVEAPQGIVEDRSAPVLRQQDRPLPRVFRNRVPIVSNTPREGTQPTARTEGRRHNWVQWSTSHWRNDRKYDWKNHRRRHRSLFHLGFYYDPFGWNYRPYSIGWRLWPSYYSSRFWIDDPYQYRLPYAPPGYRWIRYYDDALLVDTWDGRVVDVIYNFFW